MVTLALILIVLTGLWLVVRGLLTTQPKTLARTLRIIGWSLTILLVVGAAVLRRIDIIISLLCLTLVVGENSQRLLDLWRRVRKAQSPGQTSAGINAKAGRVSTVETAALRMWLDHASGVMDGEALGGPACGRPLSTLSRDDLRTLWRDLGTVDPAALPLLEAWLDRSQGYDWRAAFAQDDAGADATDQPARMTRAQALAVLGLCEPANDEDIRGAHRRLIQRVHPDHGGSAYLAARLNEARDTLLNSHNG